MPANYSKPYHYPRPDIRYEFDQRIDEYVDFVQHLIVLPTDDKNGDTRYELSLFGIALLLAFIADYYWNPEMFFYNNFKFEEYCKKLALNYEDKLPLIFGKWNNLTWGTLQQKRIAPEIVHLLFFGHTRAAIVESSVLLRGIKEYYEGIEALTKQTYLRLRHIHEAGKLIQRQLGLSNDHYWNKLLSRKVDEIYDSLKQGDLQKFMEGLWLEIDSLIKDPSNIYANELRNMETAYADEISFLFYMFLYVHDPGLDRFEPVYSTYFPSIFKEVDGQRAEPLILFADIFRDNKDVHQLIVSWIQDSTKYQSDVHLLMSRLKDM